MTYSKNHRWCNDGCPEKQPQGWFDRKITAKRTPEDHEKNRAKKGLPSYSFTPTCADEDKPQRNMFTGVIEPLND